MKKILVTVLSIGLMSSCTSLGPNTITRDRFDYSGAIADSWKKQMLLNLVRLRYNDLPVFLDVTSVINQYNLEGEVNLSADFTSPGADIFSIGGTGRYYTRPTITYTPLQGERFTRSILTPIPPRAIFSLIQSGWPVDFLFTLTVRAINGIFGDSRIPAMRRKATPAWKEILSVMRSVQKSGQIGMRITRTNGQDSVVAIIPRNLKKVSEDRLKMRKILKLDPNTTEFTLTYGLLPRNQKEIAVLTRSMFEIMIELSTGVRAPDLHQAKGWVRKLDKETINNRGLVVVKSDLEKPSDSFAAVQYHGHWFWIDEIDLDTKGTITLLNFFLNLAETGGAQPAPVVTISAGS